MSKWDLLYLDIADRVGLMSHAVRKKVGAVLVKDRNILAFGYNGTPAGMDNCCEFKMPTDERCIKQELVTKPEVLHAESNAIAKIARSTQSSEGSTLYVTLSPCIECSKLIIQSGIKKVVYREKYRDETPITFLKANNIEVDQA